MEKTTKIGIQTNAPKETVSETVKKLGFIFFGIVLGFIGHKTITKK